MYQAIVSRILTRELPGADNLQLGMCRGYQVIVGKDVQDGELGVFFEQGGQLSHEFTKVHDLVRRKDEDGNPAGGYFEETRRVRALKLRGAKSEGFWVPLAHLEYTGYDLSQLKEGDQFEELNGCKICNKYFTPATERSRRQGKNNRGETPMFRKHFETEAFKRGAHLIPAGAVITITEKAHGTSFRYGHVLEDKPLPQGPIARLRRWLAGKLSGFPITGVREWAYLNGSRNVILERRSEGETGFYGKEDFRHEATRRIQLRKGETLYGELVGYTETGQPIMAPQTTGGLKDKKVQKAFGNEIVYRYGTIPGQCDVYVYRITLANEDGEVVEYSWNQVRARCRELGLKPVRQVMPAFVYDGDLEKLARTVSMLTDGESGSEAVPSGIDPSHLQEGVVVRYESEHGVGVLKSKSFLFGCLEGYAKEADDYVDTEEVS